MLLEGEESDMRYVEEFCFSFRIGSFCIQEDISDSERLPLTGRGYLRLGRGYL